MKSSPKHFKRSDTGWYVAVIIELFEYYDEDRSNPARECTANENLVLIRAETPDEAFEKAVQLGKGLEGVECVDDTGRTGEWRFIGLNDLLPVYDQLEDGAEIMWTKHDGVTVSSVEQMATLKSDLTAFQTDQA